MSRNPVASLAPNTAEGSFRTTILLLADHVEYYDVHGIGRLPLTRRNNYHPVSKCTQHNKLLVVLAQFQSISQRGLFFLAGWRALTPVGTQTSFPCEKEALKLNPPPVAKNLQRRNLQPTRSGNDKCISSDAFGKSIKHMGTPIPAGSHPPPSPSFFFTPENGAKAIRQGTMQGDRLHRRRCAPV